MTIQDLRNKKVAVLGLGVNNRYLADYLRKSGIDFSVVADWKGPDELSEKIKNFDVVFRTPGLPYLSEPIQAVRQQGTLIYSQTKLFFDLCPARIIGVTGTKGKGTTATLIQKILEKAGRRAYLAGNIGADPFAFLDEVKPDDFVVLELSSFQLQDLHKSPHVAVVLKIVPEHLDHHEDFEEYVNAKKSVVRYQTKDDFTVLNYDSLVAREFANATPAKVFWNSAENEVRPGCYVKNEKILLSGVELMPVSKVGLLGHFNLENVTAACAAVVAAGVADDAAMREVIRDFKGLPHRLEFVRELKDVKFYDDSFATTPETAVAAISAFESPLVLIVGGSEKKSDYAPLAKMIAASKIKTLVAIGVTGPKIAALSREAGYNGKVIDQNLSDMGLIVAAANQAAEAGDTVLLSPASASFDMFANYKQRGELFNKFVKKLV